MRRSIGLAAVALILGACSSDTPQSDTETIASITPASTTVSTTSTTIPTTSTAVPPASTTAVPGVVVYVAMGDSVAFTPDRESGVIFRYAGMLAGEFGVEIDLRDHTIGGDHSTDLLDRIRTDERLRADLAAADVVTLDIPVAVWVPPLKTVSGYEGKDPADCGGSDKEQCLQDALDAYRADTDAVIDEITAICDPDEVLIRLYDVYMLNTVFLLETGTFDVINPYWRAGMEHVEQSAARFGIPVEQVYDAFMGPDGTDDPYLKGLIGEDQLHPTAEGAAVIADLLGRFGYG